MEYENAGNVVLRPLERTDLDVLVCAIQESHASLARFLPWAMQKMSVEDVARQLSRAEAGFSDASAFEFGLFRDGALLSTATLEYNSPNPYCLDLSYWTPQRQQRKGYATLASRMAVLYGFDCLQAVRLQMSHDLVNTNSEQLARKLGFKREGVLRGLTSVQGAAPSYRAVGDAVGYGLVPNDLDELEWVKSMHDGCIYVDRSGARKLSRARFLGGR